MPGRPRGRPAGQPVDGKMASRHTTTANSVAPSIMAAVISMAVLIEPATSGWRAIDSTALPPMRPMPAAPPMTTRPAPMPAPMPPNSFSGTAVCAATLPWASPAASWARAASAPSRAKPPNINPTATSLRVFVMSL